MKGWIRRTCVGCVVALALGGPLAHAADGTITFTGAILEPTCSVSSIYVADMESHPPRPQRFTCDREVASADPATFDLGVTTVAASGIADDRVLSYFAGYARASGRDDASVKLVTQTFQ